MSPPRVTVLGVPSAAGSRSPGVEEGPGALRAAGLLERLGARGVDITDAGDLPVVGFLPDPAHPRTQSLPRVSANAVRVTAALRPLLCAGTFPLILGGDCSLTIGALAALHDADESDLGIVYFDGDLDLNTPETTPSGFFDGMVAAHILGRGCAELAGIGARTPLVQDPHFVFFGYDAASRFVDPAELQAVAVGRTLAFPRQDVEADPGGAAASALALLEERVGRFLLHFDLDVADVDAVDAAHERPLALGAAMSALAVFAASPRCCGLVVTELNPRLDVRGLATDRVAHHLAVTLAAALVRRTSRMPISAAPKPC